MVQPLQLSAEQARAVQARLRDRLAGCVPWSPAMAWAPELNLQAQTYPILEAFPGLVASDGDVAALEPGMFADSPSGAFRYCLRLNRRGRPLLTWWEGQVGTVLFDADVRIPALFQRVPPEEGGGWSESPWMSLTPGEMLTLRPGTRLAKGHVVIGGLGLGHQLVEVSRRLQVRRITLVELDAELVAWYLPRVRPLVRKPLEVVVGDAFEVVPRLRADVALIDIFPEYGSNAAATQDLARRSPGIRRFWGWGAEAVTGLGQRER